MTLRFAVVYEAEADFRTATELADRGLMDTIDWLDESLLEFQRTWIDRTEHGQPLKWSQVKALAREAGVTVVGHIDGQPAFADAQAARRAIRVLQKVFESLDGIVLLRDQDDQPERRQGLEQARTEHEASLSRPVIVVGLAVVEREAWVISGFVPGDPDEQSRLDAERQRLGFHPHEQSHELTACKDDTAPRSPKRVLRVLTGGDYDRERRCWAETPLDVLRARGTENGLVLYLAEVRTRLAPLIGHVAGGTNS